MTKKQDQYTLDQLKSAWGAGRAQSGQKGFRKSDSLVGCWFHIWKGNEIEGQGQVVSAESDGLFLVQFYEWIIGEALSRKLYHITEMKDWAFYKTNYEMRFAWCDRYGGHESLEEAP